MALSASGSHGAVVVRDPEVPWVPEERSVAVPFDSWDVTVRWVPS